MRFGLFRKRHRCDAKSLFLAPTLLVVLSGIFLWGSAQAQTLSLGPVTGGVTSSEAKVFVRTSAPATTAIEYATNPTMANPTVSSPTTTSTAGDFTAIIVISSLTPSTPYYLNVLVNGVPQLSAPYPTFKTFPPAGTATNFDFVVLTDFASVPHEPAGVYPVFKNALSEHPAFAFIGGDFDHENPTTLAAKLTMFHNVYNPASPGLHDFIFDILQQMPIAHQWDDHDSGQNNDDKNYVGWPLSYQVFSEYVPMYDTPAPPPGIWQEFSYAQADLFVLDNRSQRDSEYETDTGSKSMLDGRHLGALGELAWLKNGLQSSTATWKIIFTSIVANPTTKYPDGWAGYENEWIALRHFIHANKITNVVLIDGDLHSGGIDDGTESGFPEMLVSSANLVIPAGRHCASGPVGVWSAGVYANFSGSCQGYGVVTILTNPDRMILEVKDQNGNVKVSYTLASAAVPASVGLR